MLRSRRRDLDFDPGDVVAPALAKTRCGGIHRELVFARREVGVLRHVLVAAFDPGAIHTLQSVAVAHETRALEGQAGIVEFQLARPGG